MAWYRVNGCCCGCSLRKGSISIALLLGFFDAMMLASFIGTAQHETEREMKMAMIGLACLYAVFLLSNLLMIIGATQERILLLIFWIVATIINLLVYMGMYAYAIYAITSADNGGSAYLVMIVPWMIGMAFLYVYCILVVFSYYLSLTVPPVPEQQPQYVGNMERRWR